MTVVVTWTDVPVGSSGYVAGKLVVQLRKLAVGGWSAGWRNGMTWDTSDQLQQVQRQSSKHFKTRAIAKLAVEQALEQI